MKGIYWQTLTFKKSVIYLIKVNYTSYNYTPCNSTWMCLLKYVMKKIRTKVFLNVKLHKQNCHNPAVQCNVTPRCAPVPKKMPDTRGDAMYMGSFVQQVFGR